MANALPADAFGEDVEVEESLSFLDSFVEKARSQVSCYLFIYLFIY